MAKIQDDLRGLPFKVETRTLGGTGEEGSSQGTRRARSEMDYIPIAAQCADMTLEAIQTLLLSTRSAAERARQGLEDEAEILQEWIGHLNVDASTMGDDIARRHAVSLQSEQSAIARLIPLLEDHRVSTTRLRSLLPAAALEQARRKGDAQPGR